jgi:hypothetical protein
MISRNEGTDASRYMRLMSFFKKHKSSYTKTYIYVTPTSIFEISVG